MLPPKRAGSHVPNHSSSPYGRVLVVLETLKVNLSYTLEGSQVQQDVSLDVLDSNVRPVQ